MAELPIMPLKTDALLSDTTHMTAEEFGVYCRLLFVMWRQGGKLKEDEGELALIGGVTAKRWKVIREKVMRPMTVIGGLVSQKNLTGSWLKVQEVRRTKALASDVRWKGRRSPYAMHMHNHVESTCNPNQNQIRESYLLSSEQGAEKKESGDVIVSPELLKSLQNKGFVR